MARHRYGITTLVSQTSFRRETSDGIVKCWLFSQAGGGEGGTGEESPPLTMMTVDALDRGSLFLQLSTLVTSQTSRICAISPDEVP